MASERSANHCELGGSPAKKVPIRPPAFRLKVRLVDSTGKPLAGKDFQLWWGRKMVLKGVLNGQGGLELDVDDRHDRGILDIGDKGTGVFVAQWTIPIERVNPPPPLPPPLTPRGVDNEAAAFLNSRHDKQVILYGLAWRLRNLGYLPDSGPPVFPVEGLARDRLLNAMWRYAWKTKRPLVSADELSSSSIPSRSLTEMDKAVRKEHDG